MKKILFIFLLTSCKESIPVKEEVYDPQTVEYVNLFKAEASKRGYNLDFKGLEIIVSDVIPIVPDHPEYEAYYQPANHTIYIRSNGFNWNEMRAELVMHELGHAILKRDHDYSRLPDNSQKSLMGCPCKGTRNGWSEGHEERKEYYFDELFNPSTKSPEWAKK